MADAGRGAQVGSERGLAVGSCRNEVEPALVLLVYAVVEAPGAGWGDVRTILPLAGSAVLVAAFGLIESRHPAPLFVACAVLAGIGLALALLLPGRPRKASRELPEPAPAASAAAAGDVVTRSGAK